MSARGHIRKRISRNLNHRSRMEVLKEEEHRNSPARARADTHISVEI